MYLFYGENVKVGLKQYIFAWYKSQTCNTCMYVNFKNLHICRCYICVCIQDKKGRILLEELEMGGNVW